MGEMQISEYLPQQNDTIIYHHLFIFIEVKLTYNIVLVLHTIILTNIQRSDNFLMLMDRS